jgi:hypothetical protein
VTNLCTEDVPATKIHELKTWQPFFDALVKGNKTFEIRENDRAFGVGDTLVLKEWDNVHNLYTGREVRRVVTYITSMHQQYGYVVMGLRG